MSNITVRAIMKTITNKNFQLSSYFTIMGIFGTLVLSGIFEWLYALYCLCGSFIYFLKSLKDIENYNQTTDINFVHNYH